MKNKIVSGLKESIEVKNLVIKELVPQIEEATQVIIKAIKNGNKLMVCGNGGSAADAQHIAGEFIGRFLKNRPAMAAIALTTDTTILTCLANDFGFETVFARQIEGLAKKGDVVLGLSTSGNSKNVELAFAKAKELGCTSIALLGCGGGTLKKSADISLIVPSAATPRIQESHITIGHIICGLVEEGVFPNA
ncbi:MAG: D-sedoheptulose 7-phosphate isomerase [bacterium]